MGNGAPNTSGGGDDRRTLSYAEPPQQEGHSRSEAQANADLTSGRTSMATRPGGTTKSIDAGSTAPNMSYCSREKIRQLEAELAEIKKEHHGHLRKARAQAATKQKEVQELQTELMREQQRRSEESAELRKVDVLLKGKQQEMLNLQAEHDRLQAIVEDINTARLLAGGINIQAACPTLPEIEEHIGRALTVTVSEWIEEAPKALSSAVWIPWMLSRVFLEYSKLVDGIVRKHSEFMEGGVGQEGGARVMDEATIDRFRQHVRLHHRTLFPLTGEHLEVACTEVISEVGCSLGFAFPGVSRDVITQDLIQTKLGRVVTEYLPILVGATLQHPTVEFSNDYGTVPTFDATIHAESIDGDVVQMGQPCFVVFPTLRVEREAGQEWALLSKAYILPMMKG